MSKTEDPVAPAPPEAACRFASGYNPFAEWYRFNMTLMDMSSKFWMAAFSAGFGKDADTAKVAADRKNASRHGDKAHNQNDAPERLEGERGDKTAKPL